MNKHTTYFLFFVFFIGITSFTAIAEEHDTAGDQSSFDPSKFDYQNGDYSLITDWPSIDWTKIPDDRIKEVPPDKLVYEKLSFLQRHSMTQEQIMVNLEKIEDLSNDVSAFDAAKAIEKKYGLSDISVYGNAKIRSNHLMGKYPDVIDLSGLEHPEEVGITIDTNGRIVIEPKFFISLLGTPPSIGELPDGEYVVKSTDQAVPFTIKGKIAKVKGEFLYEDGHLTALNRPDLPTPVINNIALPQLLENLVIYFDSEDHDGSYLAIDESKRMVRIGTAKSSTFVKVGFLPGNTILQDKDPLVVIAGQGSEVIIHDRPGLAPTVDATIPREGTVEIANGKNVYHLDGKTLALSIAPLKEDEKESGAKHREYAPSSMVVKFYNEEGENLLETLGKKEKLIIDGQNNFAVVDENMPLETTECISCTSNILANDDIQQYSRLTFLEVSKTILRMGTITDLIFKSGHYTARQLLADLQALPAPLIEHIHEIKIVPREELDVICDFTNVDGCVVGGTTVYLPPDFTRDTIFHEAAHTRTALVELDETRAEQKLKTFELVLRRKYSHLISAHSRETVWTVATEDEVRHLSELQQQAEAAEGKPTFQEQWETIADVDYGNEFLKEPEKGRRYSTEWADESDSPRHGCIRAYGCNNYLEDIATFVEPIANGDHEFFAREGLIIPPGHPQYTSTKYDKRYMEKLQLLLEHQFITEEDYRKILQPLGLGYQKP